MSIIDSFVDWQNFTGSFYQVVETTNAPTGVPVKTRTLLQSGVRMLSWIDQSLETNINDQFLNNETGKIVLDYNDLTFTPTINMQVDVSGVTWDIKGVNNIGGFNEAWELLYVKDRKANG